MVNCAVRYRKPTPYRLRRGQMRTTKITALLLAGMLTLPLFGCSQTADDDSSAGTTVSTKKPEAIPDKVELKNYDFPEFLNGIKQPDVLDSPVYVSFHAADYISDVTEQPFEDYECTQMIGDRLYVYSDGKFKGLLSASGQVLLAADTYTAIAPCSKNILTLSRDKELNAPDDYMSFAYGTAIKMAEQPEFKHENVTVADDVRYIQPQDEESEPTYISVQNIKLSDGTVVGDGTEYCDWERVEQASAQSVNTIRPFSACYRAEKNGEYYYICFDRYYNYTVYDGAYGYVRLKVGEGYGECYIFDHSDYLELTKIIESFGETGNIKSPTKDPALDFIQLDIGYGTDDVTTVTLSADGYCMTDHKPTGEQQVNKYFTILDKESFISLVQWVDQVLSQEYDD